MKIHWVRVLIAGVLAQLLLFAIHFLAVKYVGPATGIATSATIILLNWLGMPFLGGLWVTRKIESRFVLHGALVGIIVSILGIPLIPVVYPQQAITSQIRATILLSDILKILGGTVGGYVGGRLRKKSLAPLSQTDREYPIVPE
jgi:hypothetical protein